MSYLLGIDAGTTRTAAAVGRPDGRRNEVEIVDLGDRSSSVPSVLYVATDRTVVVGEAAERRALTDPDRVVREFKRRIGDSTPIIVGGVPWTAQDLSARLVRWVVDRVAAREGGPADRIVVTHPAAWGTHKKDLFGAALREQGLAVTFLAEPQAAALHYAAAERVEPGSRIAVYDLGGGTFDAAVVHKAAGAAASGAAAFELLGRPEGIERLGGIDFDDIVFDHVLAGMPDAFAGLDDTDPAVLSAVSRVRRECTEAKEALSSDTDVSISVLLPSARGSVRLHRTEFEAMIRPQLEETVAALRRAVGSANLTPAELSAVLLVGGSSRIPLVAQLVSEQLGTPVAVDADPKNAIAKGAALALGPAQAVGAGATPPTGTPVAGIQRTGGGAAPWQAGPPSARGPLPPGPLPRTRRERAAQVPAQVPPAQARAQARVHPGPARRRRSRAGPPSRRAHPSVRAARPPGRLRSRARRPMPGRHRTGQASDRRAPAPTARAVPTERLRSSGWPRGVPPQPEPQRRVPPGCRRTGRRWRAPTSSPGRSTGTTRRRRRRGATRRSS